MTKVEFTKEVEKNILTYLPEEYENAEICVEEVRKLNGSYPSLVVRKVGCTVAPCVDLTQLYGMIETGANMETVLRIASSIIQTKEPANLNVGGLNEYEKIKNKLFIRIHNVSGNERVLSNAPHRKICDLAVTYHILIDVDDDEMGSTLITNELLTQYGVSAEKLHDDALKNSMQILPARVEPLEKIINRMLGLDGSVAPETFDEQLQEDGFDQELMVVLTNEKRINGAAAILYPGILKKIAERMGSDFYIIPSSVHETILLRMDDSVSVEELRKLIYSINRSEVQEKDRLADSAYRYCRESGKITIA